MSNIQRAFSPRPPADDTKTRDIDQQLPLDARKLRRVTVAMTMAGLQEYVKNSRNGRAEGLQNEQPSVNPQRQAIAANARVAMKPSVARPPIAQGLSVRGESVARHRSASFQQHPQRRLSGEDQKRDPYDTDGESLDTTVNHSVVQVHNNLQVGQPQSQPGNEESETESNEESIDEDEPEGEGEYEFGEEATEYLARNGKANAEYQDKIDFLRVTQPHLFSEVDGDSYPTTTDGNPTEGDEQQEPRFENHGSPPQSPFPQHDLLQDSNALLFHKQHPQESQSPNALHVDPAMVQNTRIWEQSARIRGQQRMDGAVHVHRQLAQMHSTGPLPVSQPPAYSQVTREYGLTIPPSQAPPRIPAQNGQGNLPPRLSRLPLGPGRTQNPAPKTITPAAPSKRASTTRVKVVPIVEQHVEYVPAEEPTVFAEGDYDPDILANMDYDRLRDESFDTDPRMGVFVLPKDMHEEPLATRLQSVQYELDPESQAKFFSALSTNEWEDAGDWFLEQFCAIVKKTKDARQNKRRAAQALEQEIEARYKHVAKKQRLVDGAMAKMKTQGEGLVPKSPRASKSPRPRRG